MFCVFCGNETDSDKINTSAKNYVCGRCVAYLGSRDQEELTRGLRFALDHGYTLKAKIVTSFLEVNNEPVNRLNRHYIVERTNGKRPVRTVRHEKRTARRFKKPKKAAFYQVKQNKAAVL